MPSDDPVTSLAARLENLLTERTAQVGVVGLGYVGLPLLVELARAGYEAVGFDVDDDRLHCGGTNIHTNHVFEIEIPRRWEHNLLCRDLRRSVALKQIIEANVDLYIRCAA